MSEGETRRANEAVVGRNPFGRPNPGLVVALSRAGALGVLDLVGDPNDQTT